VESFGSGSGSSSTALKKLYELLDFYPESGSLLFDFFVLLDVRSGSISGTGKHSGSGSKALKKINI
jgi:hypothetical protein